MKVINIDADPADKNWMKRGKKKQPRKQPRPEAKNELRKPRFIPGN